MQSISSILHQIQKETERYESIEHPVLGTDKIHYNQFLAIKNSDINLFIQLNLKLFGLKNLELTESTTYIEQYFNELGVELSDDSKILMALAHKYTRSNDFITFDTENMPEPQGEFCCDHSLGLFAHYCGALFHIDEFSSGLIFDDNYIKLFKNLNAPDNKLIPFCKLDHYGSYLCVWANKDRNEIIHVDPGAAEFNLAFNSVRDFLSQGLENIRNASFPNLREKDSVWGGYTQGFPSDYKDMSNFDDWDNSWKEMFTDDDWKELF